MAGQSDRNRFWFRGSRAPIDATWQLIAIVVILGGVGSILTPEGVKVFTGLLGVIVWPAVLIVFILKFKPEVNRILGRLTEFDAFGLKAKLQSELSQAATEAKISDERGAPPTGEQVERAAEVKNLIGRNPEIVSANVADLAEEYQNIRSSMPKGDERTRAMEAVVAKMRAIGLAAYSMRYDLTSSPAPGKRLQAIACLQVKPDFELVDWLADRALTENPFIVYHALVALNVAASNPLAFNRKAELLTALDKIKSHASNLPARSDRQMMISSLMEKIQKLHD